MRLDFVLDTNAARALGRVPEDRWEAMRAAWKRHGLTTAWTPHLLGELMASNLARKAGLDVPAIREVQSAVSRMDDLATAQIEPSDDDVVRRSLFDLAAEPAPPPTTPTSLWRQAIGLFLEVDRAEQVEASGSADQLQVIIKDASLDRGIKVVFPRGFETHATEEVRAMGDRLGHEGPVPRRQMAHDVIGDLPKNLVAVGRRLGVPDSALRQAAENQDLPTSAFGIRMICENVYYHRRRWRAG